ncbi:hypothetical protein TNCV_1357821 [Trichonephila clavipes]|uniref:Uncharacterized protein n=1 Tax=Trichonephila clavipes TaxID=2585209 RepID=A0A8X6SH72_TRICX|nr:hypothetical protein TNCV_1357821 [Trichonephila clavipes]
MRKIKIQTHHGKGMSLPHGGWTSARWSAEGILFPPKRNTNGDIHRSATWGRVLDWKFGTALDANAVSNFQLSVRSIPVKHRISIVSGDHLLTQTIARLRTGHQRGMMVEDLKAAFLKLWGVMTQQEVREHIENKTLIKNIINLLKRSET